MHHQIDSLAYTNQLRSLPAEQKIGFAWLLLILGYVAPPFVQVLIIVWLMVWVIGYAQIPAAVYLKLLALPVSFWLMSLPALVVGLSFASGIAEIKSDSMMGIQLGQLYFYLSQQGLQQAQTTLTRALSLTSCMYFILLTVPFTEILGVLRRCGAPLLLTELLLLMYRFIFVLTETASELLTAQKSRLGYGNFLTGIRSLSLVIGQLLWRSLENYRQISLGLSSRGFNGELRIWHSRCQQTNWRYLGEAIAGYSFLLLLLGQHYVNRI
jgi:cobalt/nickel transport system permease protein